MAQYYDKTQAAQLPTDFWKNGRWECNFDDDHPIATAILMVDHDKTQDS